MHHTSQSTSRSAHRLSPIGPHLPEASPPGPASNAGAILTIEEEKQLVRQYVGQGDTKAAQTLALAHRRIVVTIARGYRGYGLDHEDLVQEGNVGLMKAIMRFDPSAGVRLVTYAIHWIRAEIHEYIIRNWRIVKVATTKPQRKLFFNLRSSKESLETMCQASVEALAAKLDVKQDEVREMEARMTGGDVPLDPITDADSVSSPISYLADAGAEPDAILSARAHEAMHTAGIPHALDQLDPRGRHIIESRWLSGDNGRTATLQDLAFEFGISAERVRQLEIKALKKMRTTLSCYIQ